MTSPSLRAVVAAPAIWLIKAYQLVVSPMRPPTCRFYPSCSAYALTALERFGLARGSWLAARRLLRCHPWTPGGVGLRATNRVRVRTSQVRSAHKQNRTGRTDTSADAWETRPA